MLRTALLSLSESQRAKSIVSEWGISRRVATRFVAGDTIEEAERATIRLRERGFYVTLDHLGENVHSAGQADAAVRSYIDILHHVNQPEVQASISIKLTQLGLTLDQDLCRANLVRLAKEAEGLNTFVRIDMEDSSVVDLTLSIYTSLRQEGWQSIGLVLQSYLYRSIDDLRELLKFNAPLRLVKGAYNEPATLAFPQKEDVDNNFDEMVNLYIQHLKNSLRSMSRARVEFPAPLCVATHDEHRIQFALERIDEAGLPRGFVEFQMLFGIARGLQDRLLEEGHPVRVYVPFGTQWYPYLTRRLAERPANLKFFVSNLFR